MTNLSVFISESFFLCLVFLGKTRLDINCNISLSLIIIDSEVVLKEFLSPIDLTKTQAFCIYELTKGFMVSKDKDLIFVAF